MLYIDKICMYLKLFWHLLFPMLIKIMYSLSIHSFSGYQEKWFITAKKVLPPIFHAKLGPQIILKVGQNCIKLAFPQS